MIERREVIVVLTVVLLVMSIFNVVIATITGYATGTASICINTPPAITSIADQTATADTAFTLQVDASDDDGDALAYYDNTSLFAISGSGSISFTPTSTTTEYILITVEDNSSCTNRNTTDVFLLTVSEAAAGAPAAGAAAGGGGGGGGKATFPARQASFQVSDDLIKIVLKQGQSVTRFLTIENKGDLSLDVRIENPLERLLQLSPSLFSLDQGSSAQVTLLFAAEQTQEPGVYSGELLLTAAGSGQRREQTVALVVEVETAEVLYDASIDLRRKSYQSGEELPATITIVNVGGRPGTVTVRYTITTMEGAEVYEGEEEIALEDQVSYAKLLAIPDTLAPGQYVLAVTVRAEGSFATATEIITIGERAALAGLAATVGKPRVIAFILPLLLVLVVSILIILYFLHRKMSSAKAVIIKAPVRMAQGVPEKMQSAAAQKKARQQRLEEKVKAVREGYKGGYIRKETYRSIREKLEKLR